MRVILAIALGGSVGAVSRYLMAGGISFWLGRGFPWGTLAVNVVGSFFMGFLFQLFAERLPVGAEWRAALLVGFLGAFTTFSTFSLESYHLLVEGAFKLALVNALASVILCVVAVWVGMILARAV